MSPPMDSHYVIIPGIEFLVMAKAEASVEELVGMIERGERGER
jgi:hypothetical protein